MSKTRYTAVVWDLDGTLLDTLEDLCLAVNHALRTFGEPERPMSDIRLFAGNGVRRLVALSTPGGEEHPRFEDIFRCFKAYYVEHCSDHTGLYPGMKDTLRALHAAGYRMAVVSNKLQAGVDELYREHFSDTVELAVGERPGVPRKPAPDMVTGALREMGVTPSQAVYIGDSEVDLATARNAGLDCITVLWGFRDREWLEKQGARTFAGRPEDIVRMLTQD